MGLFFEILIALLGAAGAVIAIYEFWIKNTNIPDLPNISANIKRDDDHVVLSIDKNNRNLEGSLSNIVYKYVSEYVPDEYMEHYFIYNPNGHYLASRSLYIRDVSAGFLFSIFGILLLVILVVLPLPSDVERPFWVFLLMMLFALVIFFLGLLAFYNSRKHYKKARIAEEYVNFLKLNDISVGLNMMQKKSTYGKGFKKPTS